MRPTKWKPENWMKWDIGSEDDDATRWYLSRFDDELSGYGFFVRIVELLYQSSDHWLTLDDIFVEGFASRYGWQPLSVRQAVAWLIQAKLFVQEETADGLRFASKKVLRMAEKRQRKSKTNAENGRKGGLKSRGSKRSLSDQEANGKRRGGFAERSVSGAQAEEIDLSSKEDRSDLTTISGEGAAGPGSPPPSPLSNDEKRELIREFGVGACKHYVPICTEAASRRPERVEDFASFVRACIAGDRAEGRGFYRTEEEPEPKSPTPAVRRGAAARPMPGPWKPPWADPNFKIASPDEVKESMARFEQNTAHLKPRNGHAPPRSAAAIAISDGHPAEEPSEGESASPGPNPAAELSSLEPPTESLHNGAETA